jgi:TolA-binding protein
MGMNYKRAGRTGQARKYFQRVLDEHPDTESAARARREQASL